VAFTRELIDRVELDLHTGIDWIAAEHHDTGRPHIHLLIRRVREDGRDLVIPRPYVSHTFRERAEELATRELGPRIEREREMDQSPARAAAAQRLTRLYGMLVDREG
jgi:type IV secretory pathway VirD2 relaxase